jgi:hypothetical protein
VHAVEEQIRERIRDPNAFSQSKTDLMVKSDHLFAIRKVLWNRQQDENSHYGLLLELFKSGRSFEMPDEGAFCRHYSLEPIRSRLAVGESIIYRIRL